MPDSRILMRLAIVPLLVAVVCIVRPSLQLRASGDPAASDGLVVRLEFVVHAPESTPADATVYLAGNLRQLGGWKPDGLKLQRGDDGVHRGEVLLPRGETLEYKATLGRWGRVETGADGSALGNRMIHLERDATVEFAVAAWDDRAAGDEGRPHTIAGDVRFHEAFPSAALGNTRRLAVYLPPGYDDEPGRRYPALYLHDGQNVFDAATSAFGVEWRADETADRLALSGRIEPILIVAIANTPDRVDEYTSRFDPHHGRGGKGALYAKFVAEEVKPFIDQHYRTSPDRATRASRDRRSVGSPRWRSPRVIPTASASAASSPRPSGGPTNRRS